MTSAVSGETFTALQRPRRLTLWLLGFGAWTALALLSATQTALAMRYRGMNVPWRGVVAGSLVDWYICALFIPLFVWMVRRVPLERGTLARRVPLYLLATVGASIAKYTLTVSIQQQLFGTRRSLGAVLAANAITEFMIFWAVVGVLHAVEFYLRYREREATALQLRAALSESQLGALRAQLHPHFLFNTLNAIATLVHRDPNAADAMLTRLGELLRLTLRADPSHETTLENELLVLDRYLDIMRARFAGQLTVTIDIPEEVRSVLVPSFVLQPLVENALEHGVARLHGVGHVQVRAHQEGQRLVLTVRDDGPGTDTPANNGTGIGLANTRARLAKLYGDSASVTLHRMNDGGMQAELRLPYRNA